MSVSTEVNFQVSPPKLNYGLLYKYYTVSDVRGISPTGWHVPTLSDFQTLITYLGGTTVAGGKMKNLYNWEKPNAGATNESNFNCMPSGFRWGVVASFSYIGLRSYFLCSTEASSTEADTFYLSHDNSSCIYSAIAKTWGLSVRLIRDNLTGYTTSDTVTDYDGHIYDTIRIGDQVWTTRSLYVTHYNNGDVIPEIEDPFTWRNLTTGALCAYDNDWNNV